MTEPGERASRGGSLRAAIIALGIVAAAALLAFAFVYRNVNDEQIGVTGLGERDFQSDLIVWSGSFTQVGTSLKEAYERLNGDQERIRSFLALKSVAEGEFVFSSVTIGKEYDEKKDKDGNRSSVFRGYRLQQNVKIESKDVDKVERLSREITDLINSGVEFYSREPQYYYTKLADLKVELIELATRNGRERARKIAEETGQKLGKLKSASLGVFQIIARNSNQDVSWSGSNDTSSKLKTATITARLQFGIR
jgi:uncharacterized protein